MQAQWVGSALDAMYTSDYKAIYCIGFTHELNFVRYVWSRNVEKDKFEVIGTVPGITEDATDDEPVTLRPNRFRPKAGIRERLRINLQENLEREKLNDDDDEEYESDFDDSSESFTLSPPRIRWLIFSYL